MALYALLALAAPFGLGALLRNWGTFLVVLMMWIGALLLAPLPDGGHATLEVLAGRALFWLTPGVCAAAGGILVGRHLTR